MNSPQNLISIPLATPGIVLIDVAAHEAEWGTWIERLSGPQTSKIPV